MQCPVSDVDECVSRASCPTGLCLNTEGSFACSACESGYWVNEDGTACEGNPGEAVVEGDRIQAVLPPEEHFMCPQFGADVEGLQARLEDPIHGLGPNKSLYYCNPQVQSEDRRKIQSQRQERS